MIKMSEKVASEAPATIVVGDNKPVDHNQFPRLELFKKRSHLGVLFVFIVVAIILIFYVIALHNNSLVFTVNGKNYKQNEVKALTSFPVNVQHQSKDKAARGVYEYLKYRVAGEEVGVKFTEAQLNKYREQRGIKYSQKNYQKYLNLVAYKNDAQELLVREASYNQGGHFEGYTFIFHFDETLIDAPTYTSPHYGDKVLYARDKQYAQKKANFYHKALAANKITPEQAVKEIIADPQLGYFYRANNNESSRFGVAQGVDWRSGVAFSDIVGFIQQQKQPGLSAIQTAKVAAVANSKKASDYAEGYYYFVSLNKLQPTAANRQDALKVSQQRIEKQSKYYGGLHA